MGLLYLTFKNERVNEPKDLSETERKVYRLLAEQSDIRQKDLAIRLELSEQYVRKVIRQLKDKRLIIRMGSDKTGFWQILEKISE